ncbi:MAG: right-handed parallel beta-helix repeat-containing protein [Puia sp.]|nr:right-handed parallel beta-helix repeat-containing protein [Puia sp.]
MGSSIPVAASAGDTVYVSRFGLSPDSRQNAVKAVQQALEECRRYAHPVLVFAKGRYDFWPQYSVEKEYFESNTTAINPKRCPIWISGFKELTVDAGGSSFIYHDRVQPFTIDHSQNVFIKNVSIDWDIPLTAQAVVTDTSAQYIEIRIDAASYPYILEGGKLVFVGEGWKSEWWGTMEFDAATHMIVPQTGDAGVLGDDWDKYTAVPRPGGDLRLKYPFARKPAIGNVLVLRHSERDHAGIFITGSTNNRLENIILYQTAGLGILSQYSENLVFRNLQVVPNAGKGRYFSGHDDGCHFSNCKGQLLVEHCGFAGLMDDPINVHGTAVQIIERRSDSELVCRFMHEQSTGMEWGHPGDSVGFIDHETMQTVAAGRITGFTPINRQDFVLHFKQPVPRAIAVKDALENLTWTPDLTVRNCLFSFNRARGLLISTPGRVVVEENTFESSGSAILIAGDANQWFESGAVKDVLIRKNIFRDACLTSMYQFCEAIISIDPEIPRLDARTPFHRNIVITENEFHPFDYPVLFAKSVSGLSFTDNTIVRSDRFKAFHPRKYMFTFQACRKVTLSGNRLRGDVLGKNVRLEKMSPGDLSMPQENNQPAFTVDHD